MFNILLVIFIIILATVYYIFLRKLYHSSNTIIGNDHIVYDKIMVVAHPDDELIFGGRQLIEESGWLVICVTNGSINSSKTADVRITEFKAVMNDLQCRYEIWDYEDDNFNANWDEKSLLDQLAKTINCGTVTKIVTHNLQGEYGHVQHKKISKLIHQLGPTNLYVFHCDINQLNSHLDKLSILLDHYSSQSSIIQKHLEDIKYQSIKPSSTSQVK